VENGEIKDEEEMQKLNYLLKTKKWNPYCIRHSAMTSDSDYLPEYALKKKVRWSMNSKHGSRYIKKRMYSDLKNRILEHNGTFIQYHQNPEPLNLSCSRCNFVNAHEYKYYSECSYPLTPEAFDQLKQNEEQRFTALENKLIQDMESKIQQILLKVNVENLREEQ